MAPQPYPVGDPGKQLFWFAQPRNNDFSAYFNANKASREDLQNLIIAVVGIDSVEDLQELCQSYLQKTNLWRSGVGATTYDEKNELANDIIKEIDDVYDDDDTVRQTGYDAWLKKAMMSYLGLEIRLAKAKDLHLKKTADNDSVWNERHKSLPLPHNTSGGSIQQCLQGDRLSRPLSSNSFTKFPHHGDIKEQARWFENPSNNNFAPYRKLKQKSLRSEWAPLIDTIVDVIGLENSIALENLCKPCVLKTELWQTGRPATTPQERAELVDLVIESIKKNYRDQCTPEFLNWINGALSAYVEKEIGKAKRTTSERKRNAARLTSDPKRAKHTHSLESLSNEDSFIGWGMSLQVPSDFPSNAEKHKKVAWLSQPRNSNFAVIAHNVNQSTGWDEMGKLITKVVGLEDVSTLNELLQDRIKMSGLLFHTGSAHKVTKQNLIRELFDEFKILYNEHKLNSYEVYYNWVVGALRAYIPRQVRLMRADNQATSSSRPGSPGLFVRGTTPKELRYETLSSRLATANESQQSSQSSIEDLKAETRRKQLARQQVQNSQEQGFMGSSLPSSFSSVTISQESAHVDYGIIEKQFAQMKRQRDEDRAWYERSKKEQEEKFERLLELVQQQPRLPLTPSLSGQTE